PRPLPPSSYPLSLHDALPISEVDLRKDVEGFGSAQNRFVPNADLVAVGDLGGLDREIGRGNRDELPVRAFATRGEKTVSISRIRSEEHTSELQSRENLVCRLL